MLPDASYHYDKGDNAAKENEIWMREDAYYLERPWLVDHCIQIEAQSILEFGPGSGILSRQVKKILPKVRYVAVEKSKQMLALCIEGAASLPAAGTISYLQGDVRQWPLGWKTDVVCGFRLLKHIGLEEWDEVLCSLLGHGKYAAFDVQLAQKEYDDGIDFPHTSITEERLAQALQMAGHEVLDRKLDLRDDKMECHIFWTRKIA